MKKNLFFVMVFIALGALVFAQPSELSITIPSTDKTIQVDGYDADALWAEVHGHTYDYSFQDPMPTPSDISATIKMAWSNLGLLVFVAITDDMQNYRSEGDNTWEQDNTEFYFYFGEEGTWGPDATETAVAGDSLFSQIRIQLTDGLQTISDGRFKGQWGGPALGDADDGYLEAKAIAHDFGWNIEAIFPWELFSSTLQVTENMKFGFEATVIDADESKKDNGISLMNDSGEDISYDDKRYLNTLVLGSGNPSQFTYITDTICEGENYVVGDSVYSTTGTFETVLPGNSGNDSTVTLDLTVTPAQNIFIRDTICKGETYVFRDSVYSETGVYETVYVNNSGCDTTVVLDLTVKTANYTYLTDTICEREIYRVGDSAYSKSGIYETVFPNNSGCDTIILLDLTVKPLQKTYIIDTICEGEAYPVGDSAYYSPGVYETLLQNNDGCGVLVNLDLTVNPTDTITKHDTLYTPISRSIDGSEGSESDTITNTNRFGCDSVVITNYTVIQTTEIVSWDDETGNFKIYPNPTTGIINLSAGEINGECNVQIFSETGEMIFNENFTPQHLIKETEIDLKEYQNGIYLIRILSGNHVKTEKIILRKLN